MPVIEFICHDGAIHRVNVTSGTSVMQAAVRQGLDAVLAECGGCSSCGTCHVYIDEAWTDKLNPPSETERSMLDCVIKPAPNSRLSCQIQMSDELDGLVVSLPESQF
ncbi:(2Fe-2S)-binding protein (plasmid) [Paraburkholderia sprentiae WSM5005]|uniref:(2Fe-2S)-binding protein n=1 Tax=Paraburkholderia sprentiae WSM5005 TaxID=754502 RepID=A0A8F4KHZ8_9BURK|nr:2Fe-2S iron-sulfur cluster-binding protein [Paraburkholderia sprentiae]QXE07448.1 (2Fe-2S)-binding protein [Paraburkholderia sprentiae WSM5005]